MSGKFLATKESATEVINKIDSLGGGIRLLSKTTGSFSRRKADEILGLNELIADRPLKPRHVEYLVRQVKAGTMRWEHVMLMSCVCLEDGKEYRINGQHTAWARLEFDDSIAATVQFLKYEAATESDMRRLYASVDRGSPRTRRNVTDSYLLGTPEFSGFNVWSIRAASSGLAFWLFPISSQRKQQTPDDMAFLMLTDHLELSKRVCSFLDSCSYSKGASEGASWMFRQSVTGAIFATFDRASSLKSLDEFWGSVRDGIGMVSVNDPRLRLRNSLQSLSGTLGASPNGKLKADQNEIAFDWCIRAWNAFRKGEPLLMLKRSAPEDGRRAIHR